KGPGMAIPIFLKGKSKPLNDIAINLAQRVKISSASCSESTVSRYRESAISDLVDKSTNAVVICDPPISTPNTTRCGIVLIFRIAGCDYWYTLSITAHQTRYSTRRTTLG